MQYVGLRTAIGWAYEIQIPQVAGPSWMDTERFDIDARSESTAGEEQLRLMLQKLLADLRRTPDPGRTTPPRTVAWFADRLAGEFQTPIVAGQAMEEQPGLKLELRRLPLEVLIVDHAEKVPVEN
jgi:hypothetical protein